MKGKRTRPVFWLLVFLVFFFFCFVERSNRGFSVSSRTQFIRYFNFTEKINKVELQSHLMEFYPSRSKLIITTDTHCFQTVLKQLHCPQICLPPAFIRKLETSAWFLQTRHGPMHVHCCVWTKLQSNQFLMYSVFTTRWDCLPCLPWQTSSLTTGIYIEK